MRFSSILFDLDGTLLDTLDDLANACNRSLESLGFPTHQRDAYRYFVGDGLGMLFTRVLPEDRRDSQTIEACRCAYYADYAMNWNVDTRLYVGMADLLDALTARRLRLAVLSNKPHEFTAACCAHYLNRWKFDVVLGQTPDLPRKPDPAPALEVARRMNETPANFLYLGDTATDMKTATGAGMNPIGALWGFRTRDELESSGAAAVIAHPMDLLALLENPLPSG